MSQTIIYTCDKCDKENLKDEYIETVKIVMPEKNHEIELLDLCSECFQDFKQLLGDFNGY